MLKHMWLETIDCEQGTELAHPTTLFCEALRLNFVSNQYWKSRATTDIKEGTPPYHPKLIKNK
ncbi:Protein of unknown function [Gryllus bimaculatus]|nr:Protein of unknown function [Gryllus bimaculatus]